MANVEQAVVVGSLRQPGFQPELLDRFLVHAEREGLEVLILLTKRDLLEDGDEVEGSGPSTPRRDTGCSPPASAPGKGSKR